MYRITPTYKKKNIYSGLHIHTNCVIYLLIDRCLQKDNHKNKALKLQMSFNCKVCSLSLLSP